MAKRKSTKVSEPADSKRVRRLKLLRQSIRDIDDELFSLVAKRLQIARQIGDVKLKASLPLRDYRVEEEVLRANQKKSRALGVSPSLSDDFTRLLIRHSVIAQGVQKEAAKRTSDVKGSKILIIGGLGQMGKWLGQYFDSMGHEVSIYDQAEPSPQKVKRNPSPSFATMTTSLVEAVEKSHYIVIATPISATSRTYDILIRLRPKGIIFDICSLKSPLIAAFSRAEKAGLRVASIHPMFGPSVKLLAGRNIVICRGKSAASAKRVAALFDGTSARLVHLKLHTHDKLMSFVLGMSHLSNLAFAHALAESGIAFSDLEAVSSTTFQRQLRVSRPVVMENPQLYFEIQKENAFTPRIVKALRASLDQFSRSVAVGDRVTFETAMEKARKFLARADKIAIEEEF